MEAIIEWINQHPIITAVVLSLVGGQTLMPILKKITILTPSKADDLIVEALERAVSKKNELKEVSPSDLEKQLSLEAINEIIRLRKMRIEKRKKYALENKV
jgi:hypothetical protein